MLAASSEQRNTIGPAISSGVATRPTGIVASIRFLPSKPSASYVMADISVSTQPGATESTVMPRRPASTHSEINQ